MFVAVQNAESRRFDAHLRKPAHNANHADDADRRAGDSVLDGRLAGLRQVEAVPEQLPVPPAGTHRLRSGAHKPAPTLLIVRACNLADEDQRSTIECVISDCSDNYTRKN